MKIVATIEARMTSSRLPGKVLMKACGKPMLELLVERLQRVPQIDNIVIATTYNETDDRIHELADRLNVSCYRGSEIDVLGRVLGAAKTHKADVIVEITGDCPLLDPEISSQCIREFFETGADYASVGAKTYPAGMVTQVFPTTILNEVDKEFPNDPAAREHVSLPIYKQANRYKLHWMVAPSMLRHPEYNFCLDTPEDFLFIKTIFERLYPANPLFQLADILLLLRHNPELALINLNYNDKLKQK